MASDDAPKKPLPSAAEIQAYLELSAARTKKRLPLSFEAKKANAAGAQRASTAPAEKKPRALPVRREPTPAAADSAPPPSAPEGAWTPFTDDEP